MKKSTFVTRIAAAGSAAAAVVAPMTAKAVGALEDIKKNANITAVNSGTAGSQKTLPELAGQLIQAALGLLGIVLVVIVIYAGFLWMTAQGNDDKIKQAKKMITNAVVGLVLIFAAYAITNFVLSALTNAVG